ncbi:PspC domain-containing protein [Stomatohabitans albus]|uniref:PspC domain-containing protein n=1 Tax=Stomatohabitans albus TaxID=3110766 RepID=UPI00300C066D
MSVVSTEFRRDRSRAIVGGVCAGLATYFGSTPNSMRLVFVLTFLGLSGVSLPIYFILWVLIPADSPREPSKNQWMLWLFWLVGPVASILLLGGVLSAELPLDISLGMTMITIGGLLLSSPRPLPQPSAPRYAPGQVITKERTEELE